MALKNGGKEGCMFISMFKYIKGMLNKWILNKKGNNK
jgi:hypothetical protein